VTPADTAVPLLSDAAWGALSATSCALSWAVIGLLVRALSSSFNSVTLNAVRSAVGGAVILAWVLATEGTAALTTMSSTAWVLLSISVLMAVGFGDTVFFESTRMLGLARAMTVSMTYPLIAALLAAGILGEPLTPRIALGAVVTLGGVAVTIWSRPADGTADSHFWPGVGAATLASLAWAVSVIFLRPALAEVDAVRAQAVRLPVAAALLWATPWTWSAGASLTRHGPGARWRLLALGGLTAASSILFVAGVRYAGVAVGTVLSSTSPLFAIPLGLLFLGERVAPIAIVGALLTIAGIALLQL
jgi:drug/metabolite transporter (DMT)-like permease